MLNNSFLLSSLFRYKLNLRKPKTLSLSYGFYCVIIFHKQFNYSKPGGNYTTNSNTKKLNFDAEVCLHINTVLSIKT